MGTAMKQPEQADWQPFDMRVFTDEGLLHYINRTVFWPLGLALTANQITNPERAERYVRDLTAGIDLDDATRATLIERAAAMIPYTMTGMRLDETVPPEQIVSALSVDEATRRENSAERWIRERRRTVKP
jgi:hypothetical protein